MKCTNPIQCGCDSDAREGCPFAIEATCPYCTKADAGWIDEDIEQGHRPRISGGVEYHCDIGSRHAAAAPWLA